MSSRLCRSIVSDWEISSFCVFCIMVITNINTAFPMAKYCIQSSSISSIKSYSIPMMYVIARVTIFTHEECVLAVDCCTRNEL